MNIDWEREQAVTALGNFLTTLDHLELCEWELWWLTLRDWSVYAPNPFFSGEQ